MNTQELEQLKYPIGKYDWSVEITPEVLQNWIKIIDAFPTKLEALVSNLSDMQLDTPYRPDGWTVRQVVHHVVDSHANSYVRYKWTLTEDKPVIKAYYEDRWAEVFDYKAPIYLSLTMLKALHAKWVYLLKGLSAADFRRSFIHPETKKEITLEKLTGMYAWHCNHHYAHVENLVKRQSWT